MPGSLVKKAKKMQIENFKTGKKRRRAAFRKGANNIDTIFDPMEGNAFTQ